MGKTSRQRRRQRRAGEQPPPASTRADARPWHPLHLLILCAVPWAATGLPMGLAAVSSTVFAALNWRRLGEPMRAWTSVALLVAAGALPLLVMGLPRGGLPESHVMTYYFLNMLTPFGHLHLQRNAFEKHREDGGEYASVLPFWIVNAPAGILSTFMWFALAYGQPG